MGVQGPFLIRVVEIRLALTLTLSPEERGPESLCSGEVVISPPEHEGLDIESGVLFQLPTRSFENVPAQAVALARSVECILRCARVKCHLKHNANSPEGKDYLHADCFSSERSLSFRSSRSNRRVILYLAK